MRQRGCVGSSRLTSSQTGSWTSAASQTLNPKTWMDSLNVTSLPESEDGHTPCNSQDGPLTDLFGQLLSRVSHFPAEETPREHSMIATSGRFSPGSSESIALEQSLASRLRERLASTGSTEYAQTWRRRRTPLGRVFWEHIPKLLPTRDNDFSGLPTPTVNSILEASCPKEDGRVRFLPSGRVRKSSKKGKEGSMNWSQDVLLRGYLPTPRLALFLMGYPDAWWECAEQAMQSSLK